MFDVSLTSRVSRSETDIGNNGLVTELDLGNAHIRYLGATMQAMGNNVPPVVPDAGGVPPVVPNAQLGGNAPPPWFHAAVQASVPGAVQAAVAGIHADIAHIASLQSMGSNNRIAKQNRTNYALVAVQPGGPIAAITLLEKETPGLAANPPVANMNPTPQNPIPKGVNQVLNNNNPAQYIGLSPRDASIDFPDITHIGSPLTQAEIGYLSRFYNNTFGIVINDNCQVQRMKFSLYCCRYYIPIHGFI